MSTSITLDQRSYNRLQANLAMLPRNVGLRVYRVALNAWGGVVKAVQQSKAKKGATGLLAKSPAVKVKIPDASFDVKHHGKPAYVIVGPSRSVVGETIRGQRASKEKAFRHRLGGGTTGRRRPSRYAHLVEAGIAGKRRIQPDPFVADSARAGEGIGLAKFEAKMSQGIAAEAARLPK